jgi:hypothetical protein
VTFDRELIPFRYGWLYTHPAKVTNAFYDTHHITETYLALPAAAGVQSRLAKSAGAAGGRLWRRRRN